ncbi:MULTISPECIES: hypothetical protein [unclassified Plantactinospora]|uniref:hypothetical protein n=1 Tax=unclassified Plantactinospora TaxID=2631981 RepID=UPI0018FE56E9|nr:MULTISPECIES: hypothetical protein [unclassified Plantactinospora]
MADQHPDPSGNTEAFRAFVHSPESATAEPPSRLPLIAGIAVAVVVVAALVGWLALG